MILLCPKQLEEEKRKQKIEIWETMQEGKSYKAKLSSQVMRVSGIWGLGSLFRCLQTPHTLVFLQGAEEASSSSATLKPKSDKKLRSAGM